MPNIIITSKCNLTCDYCFANNVNNNILDISIENFINILNWCATSSHFKRIGIIGGEPTLHPQLLNILTIVNNYCQKYNITGMLFTNGIFLNEFLNNFPKYIGMLININELSQKNYNLLINNLNKINQLNLFYKTTLGCNLYKYKTDYTFFWDIIKQYPNIRQIRCSVTCPINDNDCQHKDEYYLQMKEIFLNFLNQAIQYNINLNLDCNYIPLCYFNNTELQKIKQNCHLPNSIHCEPPIDIFPNFMATACFGIGQLINCQNFENYDQLIYYIFHNQIMHSFIHNDNGKCKTCLNHKYMKCQGGCLAFAKYNNIT